MTVVLIAVGVMLVASVVAAIHLSRPETQRALDDLDAAVEALKADVGARLVPPIQRVADALSRVTIP